MWPDVRPGKNHITAECHYNTMQYNVGIQCIHRCSDWGRTSQKTPHISPSQVSYGVIILEKTHHIIMAPHCILVQHIQLSVVINSLCSLYNVVPTHHKNWKVLITYPCHNLITGLAYLF